MNSRSRLLLVAALVAVPVGAVLISFSGSSSARAAADVAPAKRAPPPATPAPVEPAVSKPTSLKSDLVGAVADAPIADFQVELLELASKSASKIPSKPHVKSRSRAQEKVVVACLELDQPRRAAAYIAEIDNWRRGLDYADLAFYLAKRGDTTDVQHYLDVAQRVSEVIEKDDVEGESSEGWRRDRIRSSIARTYALLGDVEKAAVFEAGVVDSESGRVAAVVASQASAEDFDRRIALFDEMMPSASFDQLRAALEVCAQLFDRFYDDAERRAATEERIRASWTKLPLQIRIELLMRMSGFALAHDDRSKALALLNDAQAMLEGYPWAPEHRIPLMTALATARYRAGDVEHARQAAQSALGVFDTERASILGVDRASALRCIAEAYQALGDSATALAVYERAVEEGAQNPNARPRAEDLTATCCSMARHGVEPDAALRARLEEICAKLVAPW